MAPRQQSPRLTLVTGEGPRAAEAGGPLLAVSRCELCGLVITDGRGRPWPSCRGIMDNQLAGGA